jgi:ribosome-binding factor A
MSIRGERIAEQIRQEIARVLREEVSDPRIGMLTLTRVKVSPDLSTAVVLWSPLVTPPGSELEQMSDGLDSASGFVRRKLAQNLQLRRTPEVKFEHDPSIEEGSRTLDLLQSLRDEGNGSRPAEDGAEEATPEEAAGTGRESSDGETT